jgi:AcrR family transcriptional regulator
MTYLRKQPRQQRSATTFEAIVEAAARILAEDGPRRLTTNRIAERAGVSVGSLYQYFPNRLAIVRALVERELERAERTRPPALADPTRPLAERIRAAVDWHLDVHGAGAPFARALDAMLSSAMPADERRRLRGIRAARVRGFVEGVLDDETRDVAQVAFVVDVCLDALSDAVSRRRPEWLASEGVRAEMALLLERYLAPGRVDPGR